MTGRILPTLTAASRMLAGCAHPSATSPEAAMPTVSSPVRLMPVKEWPLRFRSHSFAAHCYDTYGCKVIYAGLEQRGDDPDELRPSSAGYGPDYRRNGAALIS